MWSITRSMVGRCVGILRRLDSLLDLQMGHMQFLFLFFLGGGDHPATERHDTVKYWPAREDFIPQMHNVKDTLLLNLEKVLLPPLHIKLGIMKNLVKALDKSGEGFLYLCSKFPNLSDVRGKWEIFVGLHIGNFMCDKNFKRKFNSTEMAAWTSFRSLVYGFVNLRKEENYQKLGCQISLNIHM